MAGVTLKQADRLYALVDELAEDALTVRDELLAVLTDPATEPEVRDELSEELAAALGDLRVDWRRLLECARRVPALGWPADAAVGSRGGRRGRSGEGVEP